MSAIRETFAKKFGASGEQIQNMINQIGFIESNNQNITQKKKNVDSVAPGRGYFQFETKDGSGAFKTALQRVKNRYDDLKEKVPDWVSTAKKSDNAMTLSREQQEEVLLANLWYESGSDPLIKKAIETGSAKELWLQSHWKGSKPGTEDYKEKASQWDKHMERYESPEPIKNIAFSALDEIKNRGKDIAFNSMQEVNEKDNINLTGLMQGK